MKRNIEITSYVILIRKRFFGMVYLAFFFRCFSNNASSIIFLLIKIHLLGNVMFVISGILIE